MKHFTLLVKCMLVGLFGISALQVDAQFYAHGFENTSENANWTFVGDVDSINRWTVGRATFSSGTHGLYVSTDNGTTAKYVDTVASVVMAYREFTLPAGATYSISFNWRAMGSVDDYLTVCWVDDPLVTIAPGAGSTLPSWVATHSKAQLSGRNYYSNESFTVTGTGQPVKLVFIWKNDNLAIPSPPNSQPGGCIDNIFINENTPMNYSCGFEDAAENAKWRIQTGSNANKWVIGQAVSSTPRNSLYISNSPAGDSANYINSASFCTAVREFVLPYGERFDISFDWLAYGEKALDKLYVCWVDDTTTAVFQARNNSNLPNWVEGLARPVNEGQKEMSGTMRWKNGTFTVIGTGLKSRLVFVWVNNTNNAYPPGGAIDNIQIGSQHCPRPDSVQVNVGTSTVMTWAGNAPSYEISYCNTSKGTTRTVIPNVVGNSYTFNLIEKGLYTFWIRANCDSVTTSIWSVVNNVLVITNDGCINFLDLNNAALVRATTGSYSNPTATVGVVDYGPNSDLSRHTVHTIPESDPNTGGGLLIVPADELAVVRLGNSDTGAEAESLTYTYTVDSIYKILLLKYAVVLQNPSHGKQEQPKFIVKILDSNDREIDPSCGILLFYSGFTTSGWQTYIPPSGGASNKVEWKDWSTLGLNLDQYIGQTIKVQLTTYDCDQSGHFGYAYFTLNCAKGNIEGLSCGDEAVEAISAPDGFNYRWYKEGDPNTTITTSQDFTPLPTDTSTYMVELHQIGSPGCFFTLKVSLAPRWPLAKATSKWTPANCRNSVTFTNISEITSRGGVPTGDKPDNYEWTFSDGQTSNAESPVITFSPLGGTYNVTLVAGISDYLCSDTLHFTVNIPPIGEMEETRKVSICRGDSIKLGDTYYHETGIYRNLNVTMAGCDSIEILDLTVHDKFETTLSETICEGESSSPWAGAKFATTGTYILDTVSSTGCDSTVTFNLQVNPVIDVEIDQIPEICGSDLNFIITFNQLGSSVPTGYELIFDSKALGAGFVNKVEQFTGGQYDVIVDLPANAAPDFYTVTVRFVDEKYNCTSIEVPVTFTIGYPNIIEQNWNDVIALLNNKITGYSFKNYQWYKNNDPIPGANKSYLYLPEGLDLSAYYRLQLTRTTDNVTLFTCPLHPQPYSDIHVVPIVTFPSNSMQVTTSDAGIAYIWDVTGVLVSTQELNDKTTTIKAPSSMGMYVLDIQLNNGTSKRFKIVVKKEM